MSTTRTFSRSSYMNRSPRGSIYGESTTQDNSTNVRTNTRQHIHGTTVRKDFNGVLISSATFTIADDVIADAAVGTLVADAGVGSFQITSGNPDSIFQIHATTGVITIDDPAEIEIGTYLLTCQGILASTGRVERVLITVVVEAA